MCSHLAISLWLLEELSNTYIGDPYYFVIHFFFYFDFVLRLGHYASLENSVCGLFYLCISILSSINVHFCAYTKEPAIFLLFY